MNDRILRPIQISERLGLSIDAVRKLLKDGGLERVQLTKRAIGCLSSNVDKYIESKTGVAA